MKLIETLGSPYDFDNCGIFHAIEANKDTGTLPWLDGSDMSNFLDELYYFNHSGEKTITKLFRNNYAENIVFIAELICRRYQVRWDKIYTSIFGTDYNILNDNHRTIVRTPDLEDSSVQNSATRIVTQGNVENEDSIFGFNSPTPVGTDTSSTDNERVVSGDADDNETTTVHNQSGTETIVENGSNTSPQKRLQDEIDFRKRNDFFEILFRDVDTILTLLVYE